MNSYDFSVKSIEFSVMRISEQKWNFPHGCNPDNYILAFAENGCANYVIDNKKYRIEKGAMMFFKKGLIHSAASDINNPWIFFSCAFDITCFSDKAEYMLANMNPVIYPSQYEKIRETFFELYNIWTKKSDAYMLKCRSLLEDLIYIYITSQINTKNHFLHREALENVKEFIMMNYRNNFSIQFLADMANMSPSYFRTLFKKYTGYL